MEVQWSNVLVLLKPLLTTRYSHTTCKISKFQVAVQHEPCGASKRYCVQHGFSSVSHLPPAQVGGISRCLAYMPSNPLRDAVCRLTLDPARWQ